IAASRAFDLSPPVVTWAFLGVRAMTSPLRCCSFETKARRWHWHNDIGGNYPVDNQPLMVTGPVISHQHNPHGNRCSIYSSVSRVGSAGLSRRAVVANRRHRLPHPGRQVVEADTSGCRTRTCPSARLATRPTEIRTDGNAASPCPG